MHAAEGADASALNTFETDVPGLINAPSTAPTERPLSGDGRLHQQELSVHAGPDLRLRQPLRGRANDFRPSVC
jgi:hypothetical protein